MTDAYDWSQFTLHMYYRASIERVFAAWSTSGGLTSFFIREARHVAPDGTVRAPGEPAQPGDRYAWDFMHPFRVEGEFLPSDEREVAFTFGGAMRVKVTVRQVEEQVEVRLHQTGCATEDPDRAWQHLNCRTCWTYFMTNLKSVLEHDTDLRDRDRPAWNDSVSIGWAPDLAT